MVQLFLSASLLPESTASPAIPMPLFVKVGVCNGLLMATQTKTLEIPAVSFKIFGLGNRLKMIWVNTNTYITKVIKNKSIRDSANRQFVNNSMDKSCSLNLTTATNNSVPCLVYSSSPKPTSLSLCDSRPKTIFQRANSWARRESSSFHLSSVSQWSTR